MHFREGHPTITAQRSIAELIDSDAAAFGIYQRHGTAAVEALAALVEPVGRAARVQDLADEIAALRMIFMVNERAMFEFVVTDQKKAAAVDKADEG